MSQIHLITSKKFCSIIGLSLLLLSSLLSFESFGQNTSETIGKIGKKVELKKMDNAFLISYKNYNLDSDKTVQNFTIENKKTLDRLYDVLMQGFASLPTEPITFELSGSQLRLYYINKKRKDKVEIIHEIQTTEETGALVRLNPKQIQKLFGKN